MPNKSTVTNSPCQLLRYGIEAPYVPASVAAGGAGCLLVAGVRLPAGRAVGVDLWRSQDQSGNDIAVTRANAENAGVADRVELYTADMTELPFEDNSFDVVTSALAIHNIPTAAGRHRALDEALRVLRPGGRLLIADFRHTTSYREQPSLGIPLLVRRSVGRDDNGDRNQRVIITTGP